MNNNPLNPHVSQPSQAQPRTRLTRMHRDGARLRNEILRTLIEGDLEPSAIASYVGMTLQELAEWISEPGTAQLIENLARLADVRAALLVSRFRAAAAGKLINIMSSSESQETSRRACLDLLKVETGRAPQPRPSANAPPSDDRSALMPHPDIHDPPIHPPTVDAIMCALEQLEPDDS